MIRRLVVSAGTTIAASVLLAGTAAAQTGVLAGTIFGTAARTPLAGATVTIVGTNLSAVTDRDGRFTIADVPAGDAELRVRRAEFFPLADRLRIAAGDTTRATYQLLHPDDERDVAAAPVPAPRLGVSVDTATITFAGPETAVRKPLIIVDGVIMFDGDDYIRKLDPSGIETVEVIKGEAAKERYGPRGSAGVVRIRTKAPTPPPPPVPPQR